MGTTDTSAAPMARHKKMHSGPWALLKMACKKHEIHDHDFLATNQQECVAERTHEVHGFCTGELTDGMKTCAWTIEMIITPGVHGLHFKQSIDWYENTCVDY